jgi:DNA-binding MarR family transcriptional regulator
MADTGKAPQTDDRNDGKYGISLSESIAVLMRGLSRQCTQALESRLSAHNVTSGMWFPLRVLWEHDGILQHELQKQLGTAQPTLVAALDRLERRGLITRRRSKRDKRHVHVHLTKRGRGLEEEILHYADDIQSIITENVSNSELKTMHAVIEKMKSALDQDKDRIFK